MEIFDKALAGHSQQDSMYFYLRDGTRLTETMSLTPMLGFVDVEFVAVTIGAVSSSSDDSFAATRCPSVELLEDERRPSMECHRRPSMEMQGPYECVSSDSQDSFRRRDPITATPPRPIAQLQGESPERTVRKGTVPLHKGTSTSMDAVNQMLELKKRAQQQARANKLKADAVAEREAKGMMTEKKEHTLSWSGSIVAFLTSLVMMLLDSLYLVSPSVKPVKFKGKQETSYQQSWKRIHGVGMSDCDLEFFTPY